MPQFIKSNSLLLSLFTLPTCQGKETQTPLMLPALINSGLYPLCIQLGDIQDKLLPCYNHVV